MKKYIALALALCMALAVFPVFADEAGGTWYLNYFGMTAGTLELKDDGTCGLTSSIGGESQTVEGTWTAEDGKISVNANGQLLPFLFDGTSLTMDMEGIAALTGTDLSSVEASGMNADMLNAFISFTREPSAITAEEFSAYQADGTIPEGKSKEDFAQIQANMMSMFALLYGSMSFDGTGESAAEASYGITILEENFYLRDSYSGQQGYYIAKVKNENEVPVYLSSATLVLSDAELNEVGRGEYFATTGSRYLEPGEESFISIQAEVNEGAVTDSHACGINCTDVSYQTPDLAYEVNDASIRVDKNDSTFYYAAATVTNTGDAPQSGINVVIAVKDGEGNLIDLVSGSLWRNELGAKSSFTFIESIDSRSVEYCTNNGLTLSGAEAFAWVD